MKTEELESLDTKCQEGLVHLKGKNYPKALKLFRAGANQGDPPAQNNLAYMYMHGCGVDKNYQTAAEWYQKAADQSNPMAQNNLGNMYFRGYGVVKNDAKAAQWYLKAANKGYPNPHGLDKVKTYLNVLEKYNHSSPIAALLKIADSKVIRQVVNLEIYLQWAIEQNHWPVVKVLLEHNPTMDAKTFVTM